MNMIVETFNLNGHFVDVRHDPDAENPRTWCSSKLCIAHRRYDFGGERLSGDAGSIDEAFTWHLAEKGLHERDVIALPVYLYDHSGISLSTTPFGSRRDSGQLGFIYEIRADIRKEFGVKRISPRLEAFVFSRLEAEIRELDHWCNGEVYCFSIEVLNASCGGFYGYDHEKNGLLDCAQEEIRYAVRQRRCEHFARLKQLIRSKVPLQYRPKLAF